MLHKPNAHLLTCSSNLMICTCFTASEPLWQVDNVYWGCANYEGKCWSIHLRNQRPTDVLELKMISKEEQTGWTCDSSHDASAWKCTKWTFRPDSPWTPDQGSLITIETHRAGGSSHDSSHMLFILKECEMICIRPCAREENTMPCCYAD